MITLDYVIKNAKKFKRTNTASLYILNDDVYKIIEKNTWLYDEKIFNIINNYAIHGEVNPHIILPTELVLDNNQNIRGYKCRFVNGNTLQTLPEHLSTKEKIILLNNLVDLLKEINNYLVVGDINLANCMYDNKLNGYLIDFDLSNPYSEEATQMSLYNFHKKGTNKIIKSNMNTDKLKMAIICASVLYNTDFEKSFVCKTPYNNWDKFYQYTNNSILKNYFKNAFKCLNNNKDIPDYLYLPNDNNFVSLIDKDYQLIRKRY